MSPNCSEQSSSATRQVRLSDTARLAAIADFPTPPLAPTTVKSLPPREGTASAPASAAAEAAGVPLRCP